jgi:hypothetical protein
MLIDEISHSDKEKGKARNKDPKLFLHHLWGDQQDSKKRPGTKLCYMCVI